MAKCDGNLKKNLNRGPSIVIGMQFDVWIDSNVFVEWVVVEAKMEPSTKPFNELENLKTWLCKTIYGGNYYYCS